MLKVRQERGVGSDGAKGRGLVILEQRGLREKEGDAGSEALEGRVHSPCVLQVAASSHPWTALAGPLHSPSLPSRGSLFKSDTLGTRAAGPI